MSLKVSELGKILKATNRLNSIEFNAALPIKIEVKKQLNPIRYVIKLGNRETETKSYTPLEVGKKYLAEVTERRGMIQIKNLQKFPKIIDMLENLSAPPKKEDKILNLDKETILHHLANAKNRDEFLLFSNIFFSLTQYNIHHLIINDEKKAIIQYKYKKNKLQFYAAFTHLGELEGEIILPRVKIYSPYISTLKLIEEYKNELTYIIETHKKEVKELYKFSKNILDLKA